MDVVLVLLAAGNGTRFGADKTLIDLAGRSIWRWSYDVFAAHPIIKGIVIVASEANEATFRAEALAGTRVVLGGETRQQSARHGVQAAAAMGDVVLIHDAA
ncbi:MAG: bifunctional 2-C-methyl-D-erythritol 4-phosphate cytidylyltransferase/2-C-methyl-D-erythritol 2,4-cyclodiphosphate synthase, partial [Armatimonadota bacterium]